MKRDQYLRQARTLAVGLWRNGGVIPRPQEKVAWAVPCPSVITRREGPIGPGVGRAPPRRLALRFPHPLQTALGFLAAIAVFRPGYPAPPGATTNGLIGATSTGSTTISLVIPTRIRVTGFTDIMLGAYDGTALTGSSPACVSRNGPGSYSVVMTSANGGFVLRSDTQASAIPYTVTWAASTIRYNQASAAFATDTPSLAACTPVANRLMVTVPAANMDVAPPGAYGDTLRIMVTPL